MLVSMLVFVIFGLPSAGATVPLEATPPLFRWLAGFEPMHQVFLGARSLLYFGGRGDAGLSQALTMTSAGLAIGLLLGGIVTHLYDRKGFHRIPGAVEFAIAQDHQAQHQARRGKSTQPPDSPPSRRDPGRAEEPRRTRKPKRANVIRTFPERHRPVTYVDSVTCGADDVCVAFTSWPKGLSC
ncbi:hypothetical protein N602_31965 [Mycobacterium avium subsp. hominissuis 10-5606]|nr:hypothetical protein N602_31965 [Mycobacterium avium subsp. hominissuis 10-5606]